MVVKVEMRGAEDMTPEKVEPDVAAGVAGPEEVEQTNDDVVSGDADEWGDLLSEDDVEDVVPVEDEETAIQEEGDDDTLPEDPEAEAVPEESAEEVEEEPETKTPETEVAEAPEVDKETAEERDAKFAEMRSKAEAELVERFKLTEEQEDALVESPNDVLPQMMAKLYLDSYTQVMQAVQAQMPDMVRGVMEQTQVRATAEDVFFEAWPQLKDPKHRPTLDRIADTYRSVNPKASDADFVKEVGAQAWVALQLPIDQLLAHTTGKAVPEGVPAAPAKGRSPASPGNSSAAGRQEASLAKNDFEMLADEFLTEDL